MIKKYRITGIDCANCARDLEDQLKKVEGVKSLKLSFLMEKLTVEIDDELKDVIKDRLTKACKKFERGININEI